MSVTIGDKTTNPLLVTDGQSLAAYTGVTVTDTNPLSNTETVTITLAQTQNPPLGPNFNFYPTVTNVGTISDPSGGGTWNPATETFTESGVVGGDPNFATSLLHRLVYTTPQVPNGQGFATQASITVTDGSDVATDSPVIVGVLSPPAIAGTVADEPVASGNTIPPFATLTVTNPSFSYDYYTIVAGSPYNAYVYGLSYYYSPKDTATITVTDGGQATDADGLLTGPGLSKTGVGTYSLTAQQYYNIGYALQNLKFATNTLAAGQTENPTFEVDVTDATLGLTAKDTTTSVLVIGPVPKPVQPTIEFISAGQTVAPGNVLDPFASLIISDTNQNPTDSATITLTDASGKATDANGTLTGTGLTKTAAGSYTLAVTDPTTLTTELDALTFHPMGLPSGVASETTTFSLSVSDPVYLTPATATTSVTEKAPPIDGPPIIRGTVGGQTVKQGDSIQPFSGVTITDTSPGASDTAFIDLDSSGFGSLSLPSDPSALTGALAGERYALSATDPATLTKELNQLVFTAAAGTGSSTLALSVIDIKNNMSATDKATTITDTASPPQYIIADNDGSFYVENTATGQSETLPNSYQLPLPGGVGIFDPTGAAENVSRLYQAALGRAPDVAGLQYWTNSSVPLVDIANYFASSPEFVSDYGSLSELGICPTALSERAGSIGGRWGVAILGSAFGRRYRARRSAR